MCRFLFSLLGVAVWGAAQTAPTTLAEPNLNATVGAKLHLTLTQVRISWSAFTAADGTSIQPGQVSVGIPITGLFGYTLPSNANAVPAVAYTFTFVGVKADTNPGVTVIYSAQVIVPVSATPVTLEQCQVTAPWWNNPIPPPGGSNPTGTPPNGPPATVGGPSATALLNIPLSAPPTDGQAFVYNANRNVFEPLAVPVWRKYTITYQQFSQMNNLTGWIKLVTRAGRQKVCGLDTFTTTGFSGVGITNLQVTVGDANSTANLYTPAPITLMDNSEQNFNVQGSAVGSSDVRAYFTATGAPLSLLTAGSLDIDLCLAQLP